MKLRQTSKVTLKNPAPGEKSALEIASLYTQAIAQGDLASMQTLYAENFELDFVARDAFEGNALPADEAVQFWSSWFEAFPERDYHVTRSIASKEIVATQWVFIGTNTGPLMPLIFEEKRPGTGKTIRFRGVSIYDIDNGLLQRETTYLDLGTLLVELGATI